MIVHCSVVLGQWVIVIWRHSHDHFEKDGSLPSSQFQESSKLWLPQWFIRQDTGGSPTSVCHSFLRIPNVENSGGINTISTRSCLQSKTTRCAMPIRRWLHINPDNKIVGQHYRQVSTGQDGHGSGGSLNYYCGHRIRKRKQKANRKSKPVRLRPVWKLQLRFLRMRGKKAKMWRHLAR